MINIKFHILPFIYILLLGTFVHAQTAEQIIDKHFENTGGIAAWNNLNSILIEGEVSIDIGDVVPIKIEHKRPYYKRVSYIIDGEEQLSEGFDGVNAYTYNDLDGKYKRLKGYVQDAFETDILNYKKKGFTAKKVGIEVIEGKQTYKVELTKNTIIEYFWFDVEDFQLLKEETDIETVRYMNFKEVKGLTFAHRMEATPKGGKEYVVIFNKIVPNAAIDEQRFIFE